jgi:hypothetical protein
MTDKNKKPNDPDIWNKKPVASNDEITVKVQRMFPNCGKYTKCCSEVWTSKLEKVIHMPVPTDYTLETKKHIKAPEGFEGW